MRRVCRCGHTDPCPSHPRLARPGARSPWRDNAEHKRFARMVKKRAGYRCEMCGATRNLHAHHDGGRGKCLCENCHMAVDPYARRTVAR